MSGLEAWKTEASREAFSAAPRLRVEMHEVVVPGGARIPDWSFVVTPDFVNVAVVVRGGEGEPRRWVFFRQTKYACSRSLGRGELLAPVGGYMDAGEEPLAAAKRELAEEMSLEAGEWVSLGAMVPDANRGCGVGHLFLAVVPAASFGGEGAVAASGAHDDLETQVPAVLGEDEAYAALMRGDFPVHSWSACVSMSLLYAARNL